MPYAAGAKYAKNQTRETNRIYNHNRAETDKLYKTSRWLKLRKMKLAANPLCERCLRAGAFVPASIVHHKIEAKDDISKFYDFDNLESICQSCHNKEHFSRRKNM